MLLTLPAPVSVQSLEQLRQAPAGGYDTFEDVIFDTVSYPAAGTSRLTFFAQTSPDPTITNVQPAGLLPAPHYFRAHRIMLDFLTEHDTQPETGPNDRLRDCERVLNTARGILTFNSGATQRRRTGIPLAAIGGLGGLTAAVAGGNAQVVKNTPNGGFPFDQIIRYGESFGFEMNFAPGVAIGADLPLRLSLYGWRYVKVG